MTPGRPVTFVVTEEFLDHFGLESARDLPGLKELRSAGLLDSRPMPGTDAPRKNRAARTTTRARCSTVDGLRARTSGGARSGDRQ